MFKPHQRVRVMAHTDLFMMGERFAEVISVGRKWITIRDERSGRKFKFSLATDGLEPA